jgi:hypothetical protein
VSLHRDDLQVFLPAVLGGLDDAVPVAEPPSAERRTGVSDATAVPVTSNEGWEPAIVVNYPVEPSVLETDDEPEPAAASTRPVQEPKERLAGRRVPSRRPVVEPHLRGTDEPGRPDRPTGIEDRTDEAQEFEEEAEAREAHHDEVGPEPKPVKRKRASVPSWDEIMFGGPKRG